MTSTSDQSANVRQEDEADKQPSKPTTVKFVDWRHEKLVRLAAVEENVSRSAYIADAALQRARSRMRLSRDADFQRWLESQEQAA